MSTFLITTDDYLSSRLPETAQSEIPQPVIGIRILAIWDQGDEVVQMSLILSIAALLGRR